MKHCESDKNAEENIMQLCTSCTHNETTKGYPFTQFDVVLAQVY